MILDPEKLHRLLTTVDKVLAEYDRHGEPIYGDGSPLYTWLHLRIQELRAIRKEIDYVEHKGERE